MHAPRPHIPSRPTDRPAYGASASQPEHPGVFASRLKFGYPAAQIVLPSSAPCALPCKRPACEALMVPCQVCGENAASGWIYGIPPAPDRQKLGLCPKHDTLENRRIVRRQWVRLMEEEARRAMVHTPEQNSAPAGYEVEIDFLDGGRRTIQCLNYEVMEKTDLLAITVTGEAVFYPLLHIRTFHVRPLFSLPGGEDVENGDADAAPPGARSNGA
ncbi:hypothetical protein [Oceanidesulfovibrio marinus]|uniref:DUF2797 domain-containing protein n=1 Tax=Oceanidesulfovibrio marinus TaxID=370038 RepID=A0ABX6NJA7_9BACT|nr:hypothetical protein [Oceanidesulfovibrio marinus]QJT10739.1 hypothetical protein E8L03_18245 [Oceanidesulfovibrio marinus]